MTSLLQKVSRGVVLERASPNQALSEASPTDSTERRHRGRDMSRSPASVRSEAPKGFSGTGPGLSPRSPLPPSWVAGASVRNSFSCPCKELCVCVCVTVGLCHSRPGLLQDSICPRARWHLPWSKFLFQILGQSFWSKFLFKVSGHCFR